MLQLALNILWLLICIIVLCLVIYLFLYVVKLFVDVPALVEKAVWLIVLILILIGALSLLAGGGSALRPFHWSGLYNTIGPYSAWASTNMLGLLT